MGTQFRIAATLGRLTCLYPGGCGGIRGLMLMAALAAGLSALHPVLAGAPEFAIGTRLADMLRASRSVVSANQALINNAAIGDKSLTGDKFLSEAEAIYLERVGSPLLTEDLSSRDRRLLEAQRQAIRKVVEDHQDEINQPGVGFKGFVPAIFGRLMNEEFGAIVGQEARIRVTAPPNLVRNRKARPDPWEKEILATKLLAADWPTGEVFSAETEVEGRPAFRMLLPEYYDKSCLACHGEPRGELDITNYPKEGGKEGDLAGAISIVIFK